MLGVMPETDHPSTKPNGEHEPETVERVTTQIEVDSDPARIWTALTTDDGLSAWFGPGSTFGSSLCIR